ncbi:hypothetical protein D7Y44_05705 [Stenotrophomonas maltophilia]|uniref:hypothetical protein n=1 Tax=Stenotrophomonas maltophilia TaxID=40324 RepID=UPI0015DEE304|nr:hypothetical protein [Stenotrophomonas maltophilia]MBA0282918.1 hypothetical protein [Stenotrophomonas maltophilia]MBA0343760.1 hypothetical protein [Stenotrophomonas maltophilia]MBA0356943.1 hypothetical protein [Stenotrophomonas maltophilia]MBA0521683.1 hypothetical protein [Stenotrophomonas maltophilia]
MCTFITVFLPTSLPHDAAAAVFTRSGRRLFAQASPSLQAAVGPGWQPWLSAAHCDCGTALSSVQAEPEWKGDAERWRKKGWSEAKIARALAEQLARHAQDQQVRRDDALGDAGQWLQRIDALLGAGAVRIGLLVRDYDGAVNARQPAPPERHWSRATLATADLLAFAPGTLHWIERG